MRADDIQPEFDTGGVTRVTGAEEPDRAEDSLVGRDIGGFRLTRPIGRGGMGAVYLGEHRAIGSKVAIKVLHPRLSLDPQMVARFRAEAKAVNLIGHENIVSIFDFGELPDHRYYMVMEYLTGEPLSARAVPLPPKEAVELLEELCDGLAAAHRAGVVHRDLKPENIFLLRDGKGQLRVKVLDFGIAKLFGQDRTVGETSADVILGTPEFMAPEQCTSDVVDGRTDVYAAGIIAYWLLVGRVPFYGGWAKVLLAHQTQRPEPLDALNPGISAALSAVILRALEKRPEDRFATADAFARALRDALEGRRTPTPAPRATPPPGPKPVATPRETPLPKTFVPVAPAPKAPTPVAVAERPAPANSVAATLVQADGREVAVRLIALTRTSAFVLEEKALPPLRSRFTLRISAPEGERVHAVEVVQHVSHSLAASWNMPPGYGVQLSALPARPLKVVDAAATLQKYRERLNGDLYALVGVPIDAEFSAILRGVETATAELESLHSQSLSESQHRLLLQLLDRVGRARQTLTDLRHRAEHDAMLGNHRGVARCIAAGLRVDAIEECRRRFLASKPRADGLAQVHLIAGKAWEAQGKFEEALRQYELGLAEDPLNLQLHQRHTVLRRGLRKPGQAA